MTAPALEERFAARSAIEALRAGVPNSYSVRALGCEQPRVEMEFIQQLEAVAGAGVQTTIHATTGHAARGLLIRGDFGTGKSHTLEFLREIALDRKFVCSQLYISKETPLHDPVKLFQAAAESAVAPNRTGSAFVEIANQLVFNSQPYRAFERWANQASTGIDARFPASLLLFERFQSDHEFREHLIRFWAGGKLGAADVKSRLRQIGETYTPGVHQYSRTGDSAVSVRQPADAVGRICGLGAPDRRSGTDRNLQSAATREVVYRNRENDDGRRRSRHGGDSRSRDYGRFCGGGSRRKQDVEKIPALLQERARSLPVRRILRWHYRECAFWPKKVSP